MASPAVRSLLGKSKIPLPLLIRRTALSGQQQSVADLGTALVSDPIFFSPKEVVSPPPLPPQSFSIGKDSLLGGRKAWALGSEDRVRLAGRRPAVHDEDDDGEEAVDDDWDESGDDDDLKDLGDSEDFDDDDDSEDDEDVPRRKSK